MQKKTRNYHRTPIIPFCELPEKVQIEIRDDYEGALDSSFVENPDHTGEYIDLSEFVRYGTPWIPIKNPLWDGVHGTSYFSGYQIKISSNGEEALVRSFYFTN